jgi:hypothetical protein
MGPGVRRDDESLRGGVLAFPISAAYIFDRIFAAVSDVGFRLQNSSRIAAGGALSGGADGLRAKR